MWKLKSEDIRNFSFVFLAHFDRRDIVMSPSNIFARDCTEQVNSCTIERPSRIESYFDICVWWENTGSCIHLFMFYNL